MPQMSKTRPEGLVRLVCPSGIVIYPLMPGDKGYGPESEAFVRDMMTPVKQQHSGPEPKPTNV